MKTLMLLLAFTLMVPWGASAQVSGVTVEVTLDQEQFMPDEDMMVSLVVKNRSGQELSFGKDADWVTFSIENENGLIAAKQAEMPVAGEFSLKSSQSGTKQFNLTPYFSFKQPGYYRVTATIKIPQFNTEISSKPHLFAIMNGVPLPNLPDLQFGVPPAPGATNNTLPEVRRYVLERATYMSELRLYFRLTDASGAKTFKVYPLGRMVSFGQPEARIDAANNLHVLHQYYAKSFCYCVINPDGKLLIRQTHDYTQTRPTLRTDTEGRIYVAGGVRRPMASDWPVPVPAPTLPANTNATTQ